MKLKKLKQSKASCRNQRGCTPISSIAFFNLAMFSNVCVPKIPLTVIFCNIQKKGETDKKFMVRQIKFKKTYE